jgi:hypothetical protein
MRDPSSPRRGASCTGPDADVVKGLFSRLWLGRLQFPGIDSVTVPGAALGQTVRLVPITRRSHAGCDAGIAATAVFPIRQNYCPGSKKSPGSAKNRL